MIIYKMGYHPVRHRATLPPFMMHHLYGCSQGKFIARKATTFTYLFMADGSSGIGYRSMSLFLKASRSARRICGRIGAFFAKKCIDWGPPVRKTVALTSKAIADGTIALNNDVVQPGLHHLNLDVVQPIWSYFLTEIKPKAERTMWDLVAQALAALGSPDWWKARAQVAGFIAKVVCKEAFIALGYIVRAQIDCGRSLFNRYFGRKAQKVDIITDLKVETSGDTPLTISDARQSATFTSSLKSGLGSLFKSIKSGVTSLFRSIKTVSSTSMLETVKSATLKSATAGFVKCAWSVFKFIAKALLKVMWVILKFIAWQVFKLVCAILAIMVKFILDTLTQALENMESLPWWEKWGEYYGNKAGERAEGCVLGSGDKIVARICIVRFTLSLKFKAFKEFADTNTLPMKKSGCFASLPPRQWSAVY